MTDKNLIILENAPADGVVGSGDEYGSIDLNTLSRAADLANSAFATSEQVKDVPDDVQSLRAAINDLSDAVSLLSSEMYQVGVAVRTGRISVVDIEQ